MKIYTLRLNILLLSVAITMMACKNDSGSKGIQSSDKVPTENAHPVVKDREQNSVKEGHEPAGLPNPQDAKSAAKIDPNQNDSQDNKSSNLVDIDESKTQTAEKPKSTKKPPKKVVKKGRPTIDFEERKWNFGVITEGDVVEKKFKFKNNGTAALSIFSANATCGCAQPSFPFLDIAPGEEGEIGVKFFSVGKDGQQNPEITIKANTYPQIKKLYIEGIVEPKPKEEKDKDAKQKGEKEMPAEKDTLSKR